MCFVRSVAAPAPAVSARRRGAVVAVADGSANASDARTLAVAISLSTPELVARSSNRARRSSPPYYTWPTDISALASGPATVAR